MVPAKGAHLPIPALAFQGPGRPCAALRGPATLALARPSTHTVCVRILAMAAPWARLWPALPHRALHLPRCSAPRAFSAAAALRGPKPLPPRPAINEDDITESFLKGSGPGGQKIVLTSALRS